MAAPADDADFQDIATLVRDFENASLDVAGFHHRQHLMVAAWLLERMYPERWGRVSTQLRLAEPPPESAVPAEADPFEEVDELAEARRRRAPA